MSEPLYTMPVPPSESNSDSNYYQTFVRHMNRLADLPLAAKLRRAMEDTARQMETSPAHIARLLVDHGLRAPRHAFPDSFVTYVDGRPQQKLAILRAAQDFDLMQLKNFWAALRPMPQAA